MAIREFFVIEQTECPYCGPPAADGSAGFCSCCLGAGHTVRQTTLGEALEALGLFDILARLNQEPAAAAPEWAPERT